MLVKLQKHLPKKRQVKLTEKVRDQEERQGKLLLFFSLKKGKTLMV